MKFAEGSNAVEISEAVATGGITVYVVSNGSRYVIPIDERRLIEMRNWINRQLLKIKKAKQAKQ